MKKKKLQKIRDKIIGIILIIFGLGFGYLFFKLIPIFIIWVHNYTLKDTLKFFFGTIGELAIFIYGIFALFVGLSFIMNLDEFKNDEDTTEN